MNDFLELTVGALASGCIYALAALSYLLITRPTGIINFAVGEWSMLGAFGGFLLLSKAGLPYPVGIVLTLAAMQVAGPGSPQYGPSSHGNRFTCGQMPKYSPVLVLRATFVAT